MEMGTAIAKMIGSHELDLPTMPDRRPAVLLSPLHVVPGKGVRIHKLKKE